MERVKYAMGAAAFGLAALIIVILVGGCGGVDSIGQHKEYVIHMDVDGHIIPCIEVRTDHGASISCDWGKGCASPPIPPRSSRSWRPSLDTCGGGKKPGPATRTWN